MNSFKAGTRPRTTLYTEKRGTTGQTSQLHNNSPSTNNAISHPSVIVNNFMSGDISESHELFLKSTTDASGGNPPDVKEREISLFEANNEIVTEPINEIVTEPIAEEKTSAGISAQDEKALSERKTAGIYKVSPPVGNNDINNNNDINIIDEDLEENPRLRVCREVQKKPTEFIIDAKFLFHVIHTILRRYEITLTNKDIKEILQYFGDVELATKRQVIKERAIVPTSCCGGKIEEIEKVIETIKKLYITGINVIKHVPSLVKFLNDIGINF